MANTDGYNGWTNWATWNLALWAGNDEHIYHSSRGWVPLDADSAAAMARELYPDGTPDMDVSDMDDVDWQEIAAAWNEE